MLVDMRVLSFCHYLQGPACTQYLADMGADVIKVEPPGGAFERHWSGGESYVDGVSAFLMCANRNKRSLAIDLKKPAAKEIMDRLVDRADVVVENFRPGVMERLGLGYEALRRRKPEIVYASATGLGAAGPMKDRPGQDLLMQARSGLMAVTANHEIGPTAVGAAIVDQHGGALLAMGVLAGYVRRLQTGEGTRVEGSLLNAGIDLQTEALTKYFARTVEGDVFTRDRHVGSWYHHAPYGVYRVADGHIALSMNEAAKVAEALDSDALRALNEIDRYAERDRYARTVAAEIRNRSCAELAARVRRSRGLVRAGPGLRCAAGGPAGRLQRMFSRRAGQRRADGHSRQPSAPLRRRAPGVPPHARHGRRAQPRNPRRARLRPGGDRGLRRR